MYLWIDHFVPIALTFISSTKTLGPKPPGKNQGEKDEEAHHYFYNKQCPQGFF